MSVDKSGLSLKFFFRQRSTKSRISSEKTRDGSFGGGWFTMYSKSSKMAMGLAEMKTTGPQINVPIPGISMFQKKTDALELTTCVGCSS